MLSRKDIDSRGSTRDGVVTRLSFEALDAGGSDGVSSETPAVVHIPRSLATIVADAKGPEGKSPPPPFKDTSLASRPWLHTVPQAELVAAARRQDAHSALASFLTCLHAARARGLWGEGNVTWPTGPPTATPAHPLVTACCRLGWCVLAAQHGRHLTAYLAGGGREPQGPCTPASLSAITSAVLTALGAEGAVPGDAACPPPPPATVGALCSSLGQLAAAWAGEVQPRASRPPWACDLQAALGAVLAPAPPPPHTPLPALSTTTMQAVWSALALCTGAAFALNLAAVQSTGAVAELCQAVDGRVRRATPPSCASWGGVDLAALHDAAAQSRRASDKHLQHCMRTSGVAMAAAGGGSVRAPSPWQCLAAGAAAVLSAEGGVRGDTHPPSSALLVPPSARQHASHVPALNVLVRQCLSACRVGGVLDVAEGGWVAPYLPPSTQPPAPRQAGLPSHVALTEGAPPTPLLPALVAVVSGAPPHTALLRWACDGTTKAGAMHGPMARAVGGGLPSQSKWTQSSPATLPPRLRLYVPRAVHPAPCRELLLGQLREAGLAPQPDGEGSGSGSGGRGSAVFLSPLLLRGFSGDDGRPTLPGALAEGQTPPSLLPRLPTLAAEEGEGQGPVKETWPVVLAAMTDRHQAWVPGACPLRPSTEGGAHPPPPPLQAELVGVGAAPRAVVTLPTLSPAQLESPQAAGWLRTLREALCAGRRA